LNNNSSPLKAIKNLTINQFSVSKLARNKSMFPFKKNIDENPKYTLSINRESDAIANGINSGGLLYLYLVVEIITFVNW
jgi:hypothetical protein